MKKTTGGFEDTIILCLSVLGIIFALPFVFYYGAKAMYDDEWNGGFCVGLFAWNGILLYLCKDIPDNSMLILGVSCIVAWVLIFIIQHKYDLPILNGCYAMGILSIFFDTGAIAASICSIMRAVTIVSILML